MFPPNRYFLSPHFVPDTGSRGSPRAITSIPLRHPQHTRSSWHPGGAQKWLLLVCQTKARAMPSHNLGDRQSGSRVRLWSHPSLAGWPWVGHGCLESRVRGHVWQHQAWAQWAASLFFYNGHKSPSPALWVPSQRERLRHSGVSRAGAGVLGTDQVPRGAPVSQATFRGCPGEAQGRRGQGPDLSTNPAGSWLGSLFLSAQPSMGGPLGRLGRDAAWGLNTEQARQPQAPPGG